MQKKNTYIIGDIQGCYSGLCRVLDKVNFDQANDRLYAVGDLVARGEDSLATLRFLKSLGSSFSSVLGNHDLHLLAVVNGIRNAKKSDKLSSLLAAPDCHALIDWLRQFPLCQTLDDDTLLVHAGLYPQWSIAQSVELSQEVSSVLRGRDYAKFLSSMYGNKPHVWSGTLKEEARLRFIVNACTRMRFIGKNGQLDFENKSHPSAVELNCADELLPWFKCQNPHLKKSQRVIFGHWAALSGQTGDSQFIGLDTGYVWGQSMTLFHLESSTRISVNA